jgi:hypothetical protein
MNGKAGYLLVIVGLVLAGASRGHAEMVTVNLTGHVTSSDYPAITIGSLVTGSYTYDEAAAVVYQNATADHVSAIYDIDIFTLAFADGSTITCTDPRLNIVDFAASGPFHADQYYVSCYSSIAGTGSFGPAPHLTSAFSRNDPTCAALTTFPAIPAIPNPRTILALFPQDRSSVLGDYDDPASFRDVHFTITDVSVVPLPGAAFLGLIGLTCAGCRLRRRETLPA